SSNLNALASAARHRCGHHRRIARLDTNVDDGNLTGIYGGNRLLEDAGEIAGPGHRTESGGALGAAHGSQIDFRICHALADPFVLDRTIARPRHALLVQFVVVEGAV